MAGIKGVGEAAVMELVAERERGGDFVDIFDFVERVNLQAVNRKSIENLALAGAFDAILGFHRSKLFAVDPKDPTAPCYLDQIVRYGQMFQNDKNNMQQSLFGGTVDVSVQRPAMPVVSEWSQLETLTREREVTGMYLSSHPLDEYSVIVKKLCTVQLTQFANLTDLAGKEFLIGGMITQVTNLTTREGKAYGRFKLEDYSGEHEFTLFSRDYEQFRPYLYEGYFLMLKGSVRPRPYNPEELEVKVTSLQQLQDVSENVIKEININIFVEDLTTEFREELTKRLKKSKGKTKLNIRVCDSRTDVAVNFYPKKLTIGVTQDLLDFFKDNDIRFSLQS
jgi:DNA polymerase-3 subunit alpha